MMRAWWAFAGLMCAVGGPVGSILYYEHLAQRGQSMLLELAPVDPRSLMQGDYMRLDYRVSRGIEGVPGTLGGTLAVTLDERGVVTDARLLKAGASLAPGEHKLRYRQAGDDVRLGAESFFFQEGNAELYDAARYGELRVDQGGNALLVGLRDEELNVLGPPGAHPLQ